MTRLELSGEKMDDRSDRMSMTKYEMSKAVDKIAAYYIPQHTFGFELDVEFERAKQECIQNLERQLEHVKQIDWEQFNQHTGATE